MRAAREAVSSPNETALKQKAALIVRGLGSVLGRLAARIRLANNVRLKLWNLLQPVNGLTSSTGTQG
jgi:hypothetical protein